MKRILILSVLILGACGTPRQDAPLATYHDNTPSKQTDSRMSDLAIYAMSLTETPYQYGGSTRGDGFDCSGFVQYVFQNSLGMKLPRTSVEMSGIGYAPASSQLLPGDLVFFNTTRRPYSHVGIYIGEGRFVHSPRRGKAIMITSLNESYWRNRFNGARRIMP